ncbi:MAG: regulatory iron-sulfur-containing complex subunit RicT [Fermentimonas sp.]|jgi:cell fate regulator YaaT (PSP1 superfamily)
MDKEILADKLADIIPVKEMTVRNTKSCKGCTRHTNKLHIYDWLHDFPEFQELTKMVEVQFKNTRKGYYINSNDLKLELGDLVAVEATPGHDIGTVTLTGKLVEKQMKKNNYREDVNGGLKRIYRIARPADLEKYEQAKAREQSTMIRSRQIAEELGLQMKIGDVEYQGDGNKAIFYYIADERVDFRQLIKVLAGEFRVKIEMKQIGARQEAGRIGGIGPCGREMCCSSWVSNFVSVSTNAARCQDISINPQKLAGQCGKLKCCMNYEVDMYVEANRSLPSREIVLRTKDADYYHFKTDILAGMLTYSTDKNGAANQVTISKDRAFEIIGMNNKGKKPVKLAPEIENGGDKETVFNNDILEDQSITRFDKTSRSGNRKKRKPRRRSSGNADNRNKRNNKSSGGIKE